jgi:hypothetical protein
LVFLEVAVKIFLSTLLILAALVAPSVAQTTTGRLEGNVTDSQGAAVPGAGVRVVNKETSQSFDTTTDEKGHWALPSMSTGTYGVTVTRTGFKTANIQDVKIDAGVPATVNTTLEVGQLTETVEVSAGAEVLQTATATVTSTLVGRQLHELPFTSRNLTELIVTQPGSATPGVPRSTSVYGLPQTALNVTLDGLNIQDNSNRSSDGFFNTIFPRADAIEEMTITSAAAGADSNAEGALQMKLVTRSGSNAWHGGLFEQHRNEKFNANYYYNNLTNQPRDHMVFNQFGGTIGGPIRRNKLFVFANPEIFRLPQAYTEPVGTVLTPEALAGDFRWGDNRGNFQSRNLYTLAAAAGFPSTPDPLIGKSLAQIATLTNGQPGLVSRVSSNSDYNRNNINFQSKGGNYRKFFTTKFDLNVTEKHHLAYTYTYQTNLRSPDGVNLGGSSPIFPGTQNVLNGTAAGNQGGIAFHTVANLRSTITSRLTTEILFGLTGGNTIFNNGIGQSDFAQWNGYAPTFTFVTSPFRTTGQTRRNTPLKQGNANATYLYKSHLINFGFSFTQVNTWNTSFNNNQFVPGVTFNTLSIDPILSSVFVASNFPGATAADLQTNAPQLYALLTGRVSAINRTVVLDDETRKYGAFPPVVRNRQREFGFYGQDSWRVNSRFTLNYGLRVAKQNPPVNLNGIYTRVGYEGIWGVSGVGNLFKPGTLAGQVPQIRLAEAGEAGYKQRLQMSPSLGFAYMLPKTSFKPLAILIGKSGQSVLRAGYAISTLREDAGSFSVWGGNRGRNFTVNLDPATFPAEFGPAGSVLFRNPLPSRTAPTTPSFPLSVVAGDSISDYDPNLKVGYVQSWDIGFQRELTRDTVLEVRYVGNHGTRLWRTTNLNEINIFNNGFLDEFKIAQANLALARQTTPTSNVYAGLPGQQALPIIVTALNSSNDATTATRLAQGQAGALANTIATTAASMNRLTAAGRPVNMFQVNPTLLAGNANLLTNGGDTNYHGLQLEVRRRMSQGLLVQGSYTWAHSITNEFSNGRGGDYTTFRDVGIDKGPSPYDIRHAFKINWLYELPFGPKRHYLGNVNQVVLKKALEGWQLASVTRINTGSPLRFTSGRSTYNSNDSGVTFNNITPKEVQDLMKIRKTSQINNGVAQGVVYYLPQSLIDNTLAAFEVGGKTLANLDRNAPYIGPANTPGVLGQRFFLYGPMQQKWDVSLIKRTSIGEKANIEVRAQALNVFNLTNFFLFAPGNNIPGNSAIGSAFGQVPTNGAYRDLANTNDTGGRMLEFVFRLNF